MKHRYRFLPARKSSSDPPKQAVSLLALLQNFYLRHSHCVPLKRLRKLIASIQVIITARTGTFVKTTIAKKPVVTIVSSECITLLRLSSI
jgi:hypothetical protein